MSLDSPGRVGIMAGMVAVSMNPCEARSWLLLPLRRETATTFPMPFGGAAGDGHG